MKKLLLAILLCYSGLVSAQSIGRFRYDSTIFERLGGNNEVKFKNSTRDSTGIFSNVGGGWGQWIVPKVVTGGILIGTDTIPVIGAGCYGLVQPGYVTWVSGLIFDVSPANYCINNTIYNSPQTQITLAASDPTNPRYDLIVVNTSGAVAVITGTPAASPVQPVPDPTTQIGLAYIHIAAGATVPTGISNEIIYQENIEWTGTGNMTGLNFNYATNPFSGTKSTRASSFSTGQFIKYTSVTTLNISSYQYLKLYLRLNTVFNQNTFLSFYFTNGVSVVSTSVNLTNNTNGFTRTVTGSYQVITIPISAFTFFSSSFTGLNIQGITNAAGGDFQLDNIVLQTGVTVISNTGVTSFNGRTGAVTSIKADYDDWFVDTLYRKAGQDSIFYKINSVERSIKDSSGSGTVGTGTAGQLTYYQASGNSVLGAPGTYYNSNGRLTLNAVASDASVEFNYGGSQQGYVGYIPGSGRVELSAQNNRGIFLNSDSLFMKVTADVAGTTDSALVRDPVTGYVAMQKVAGGATPGLQSVITQDPVLTVNNDIDLNGNLLSFNDGSTVLLNLGVTNTFMELGASPSNSPVFTADKGGGFESTSIMTTSLTLSLDEVAQNITLYTPSFVLPSIAGLGGPGSVLTNVAGDGNATWEPAGVYPYNLLITTNTSPTGVLADSTAFIAAFITDNPDMDVVGYIIDNVGTDYFIYIQVKRLNELPASIFTSNGEITGFYDLGCKIDSIGATAFFLATSLTSVSFPYAKFYDSNVFQLSSVTSIISLSNNISITDIETSNSFTADILSNTYTTISQVITATGNVPDYTVLGNNTSSSAPLTLYKPSRTMADFYADAQNSGTGETDLYSYTTPTGTLGVSGDKITAQFAGTFNDITATAQLQLYFGGTNIANTGALTVSATGGWTADVLIIRSGATTARATVNISTPGASTAIYTTETDLTGLTFNATNIIKITGTAAGASGGSNDITGKLGTVIFIPVAN